MGWTSEIPELAGLSVDSLTRLDRLEPMTAPVGTVLFQPGDAVKGYVIVLSGRIGVHLVGANGREILLYDVTPGSSCIQSTLGLLGGEDYTAEALVENEARAVLMPRDLFLNILDSDPGFRQLVFAAFAQHMQSTMHLLERVAFQSVDARLADYLLTRAKGGVLEATQQDIASAIGSAREVVSRRLDVMEKRGWLARERGRVTLKDRDAMRRLAENLS